MWLSDACETLVCLGMIGDGGVKDFFLMGTTLCIALFFLFFRNAVDLAFGDFSPGVLGSLRKRFETQAKTR